jgi:hypothetical protein
MDIHASLRFGEYFRIWPGAASNRLEVLSFDRHVRQLVLAVKEAGRRFERRYLCGKDDVRLFIAEIRGGTTVAEAHASLRPPAASRAGTVRQGEWFFVPVTDQERLDLERWLAGHPRAIKRERPIAAGARPHVADEWVRVDRRVRRFWGQERTPELFARGAVRHVGHNLLWLDDWRLVVRNREVVPGEEGRRRMRWID